MNQLLENEVWEKVKLARHPKRPTAQSMIPFLVDDFIELHGDRSFADDRSIIAGIGRLQGMPITIIAHEKGISTSEKITRNFGMPHPEGYRKALRFMEQAQKFDRPILFIIDTPGAYPGIGAEERGQAQAIALNLREMAGLTVPLVGVVLSEGGSGGALAIGVVDHLVMLQNSIYSILSPEGFASILFKDGTLAKKAAGLMKLTAQDLKKLTICDHIIPEVPEGLQEQPEYSYHLLKSHLIQVLSHFKTLSKDGLLNHRYNKYRIIGQYLEKGEEIDE